MSRTLAPWRGDLDPHVALARLSFESYVRFGTSVRERDVPAPLPADLLGRRAGTFVSLHLEDGSLRGCIGTIAPTQDNVAQEILANAISACSRDPRFLPVREDELDGIVCSVDVLGEAAPCTADQLDPQRFGVIVSSGWKRGLLLPALEGVDTVDAQVDIARRKAGIAPDAPVDLARFEVARYEQ